MTILQMMFIAGCAVFGYWVVSRVIGEVYADKDKDPQRTAAAPPAEDDPFRGWSSGAGNPAEPFTLPPALPDGAPWHVVLGVAPDAGIGDIMQAYNARLRQYRPDHPETLAPETLAQCRQRLQALEEAYRQALTRR